MLTKRKKITKKEIRQDGLVTFYYQAISYFEQYKKNISLIGGGIAILAVIVVLFVSHRKSNNEQASFDLAQIIKVYESGNYKEAVEGRPGTKIKGLKKIVDEYGSTNFGEMAKVYLAHCYYFQKKYDEALDLYEDYGGGIEHLQSVSYAGQAACYEVKDDYEKAADLYLKAAKVSADNSMNPQYFLFAGINYLDAGQREEAKDMFETIKREYPKSTVMNQVNRYLVQVE
jgi:tetratricopeptide (TPR) repeat protein